MKKTVWVLTVVASFTLMPLLTVAEPLHHGSPTGSGETLMVAMSHAEHSDKKMMDHGNMDHDGMSMQGGMLILGEKEVDGVKASIHLKDVGEAMSKMGMDATHHFMVALTDAKTGKTLEKGVVALKIKGPAGEESKPIKLMGMQGHFGADVTLKEAGEYHFTVAAKLDDDKTRKFEVSFTK